MRKIKFRVWVKPMTDIETGHTLPGFMDYELGRGKLLAIKTESHMTPANFGFEHISNGHFLLNEELASYGDRLMQYTGLKDKNGKEIYEGDLILTAFAKDKQAVWYSPTSGSYYLWASGGATNLCPHEVIDIASDTIIENNGAKCEYNH